MKTGLCWLVLLVMSVPAFAQESDDMYFTAKDRAKLKAERAEADKKTPAIDQEADTYSSRNVNPDYVPGAEDDVNDSSYFVPNYQPNNVNPNLPNNNCYNCYGGGDFYSPFYGRMNPYNSFYGSSFYDPFWGPSYGMMGMGRGFGYAPGWSMGMGWNSFYGSSFSMSYGMGMGMGGWGSPYGFYDPFYNPYAWGGMGGYYGGGWGRPVIVINDNNNLGRNVVYQKRQDRSSGLNNNIANNRPINMTTRNGRQINTSNGRQVDTDRTPRRSTFDPNNNASRSNGNATRSTRSYWDNSNNGNRATRSSGNSWNNSWGNGNSGNQRSNSWTPSDNGSRSSGGNSGSSWSGGNSGSRSSGTTSGGSRSSSGGRGRP
jgi:hypothetical protein